MISAGLATVVFLLTSPLWAVMGWNLGVWMWERRGKRYPITFFTGVER